MNSKELPWDRLATADARGNRIYLYPSEVRGKWNSLRSRLSLGLLALFLGLPWVHIAGQQALLLDISKRKFAVFGLTFWAHDTPILFLVVAGAILTIAFITAIWGRVWCGWACPQTVFVEQVFRRIEKWIEGDGVARRRLDEAPMSLEKFGKKSLKWGAFLALSLILAHSFLAYFIGTEALSRMMAHAPSQNPAEFMVMTALALVVLFDFGWFREQFCTMVCPYGRFQSVLMDNRSTVVAYDSRRGEPRKGSIPEPASGGRGDCVNCYRCVQVCPTGIDIRRGVQLECIACTACMDACDDVMTRLKLSTGLIRYGNQAMAEGRTEPIVPWYQRSRAWVYLSLIVACMIGLTLTIHGRSPIELIWIRAVGSPYQEIPDPRGGTQVLNHFKADLRNQTFEDQQITFEIDPALTAQGVSVVVSNHKRSLAPGEPERADVFIQFPKGLLKGGQGLVPILLRTQATHEPQSVLITQEVHLVAPLR